MFDIGWSELLVIGVVALIAIGPKELPGVLRMVGQWMGKVRRMASEFQGQFNEAMREAEMADIKKQVDEITNTAKSYTNYDPLADVSKSFETAIEGKPEPVPSLADTVATPAEPAPVVQDNADTPAQPSSTVSAETPPQPKTGSGA